MVSVCADKVSIAFSDGTFDSKCLCMNMLI